MWDYSTDSEFYFRVAWWLGWGLLALVFLMMCSLILLRWRLVLVQQREQRFLARWQPLLIASIESVPEQFPSLSPRDWVFFLKLWNFLHESLKDSAKTRLNLVAQRTKMDYVTQHLMRHGARRERLLALVTLGQLQDASVWDELLEAAQNKDGLLSLTAAKTLMRIDPARALPWLLPFFASREDWPTATIAAMLKEAGADLISEPLATAIQSAAPAHIPRLLRYLTLAHATTGITVVRQTLQTAQEMEVIIACLAVFGDAEGLDTVRAYLGDARWQVRMQAVTALGRWGVEADVPRLLTRLEDTQWWVRYHAAQALAGLPFVTTERLSQFAATLPSEFGRDMLRQVRAEREWGIT